MELACCSGDLCVIVHYVNYIYYRLEKFTLTAMKMRILDSTKTLFSCMMAADSLAVKHDDELFSVGCAADIYSILN